MSDLARVLAFIEENVEAKLDGPRLAAVAGLSPFHFNRRFTKIFGVGARSYVELLRLQRAAYRLAFRPEETILGIALDTGFESHEAFGRAFKRVTGVTPSSFRRAPQWERWRARSRPLTELRARHPTMGPDAAAVRIVQRVPTRVLVLRHEASSGPLLDAAGRFIAWRRLHKLTPRTTPTFNVVSAGESCFDFCVGTERILALEPGMFVGTLAGGLHAVLRHVGRDDALRRAARWLVEQWLSQGSHGHRARGESIVLQRHRFFPDVAEREAVTDILLPLQ